jgi:predicted nucleotidyltransferase
MKTIACIAEYNPFHLGHLKHFEYIKNTLKADNLIVIMSGNFTQRGEPAVLDKYARAKHAVIAGADVVIELPTVFATSNAETFAKGAINIINSLGVCDGVCFGVESGDRNDYLNLAKEMNNESKEFKRALKEQLDTGISLAKAKFNALKSLGKEFDENLIGSPNNILGLEYTKAILKSNPSLQIYPMIREGDHNDTTLKKGITSASSIRECLKEGAIKKAKKSMPPFVYSDLKGYPFLFEQIAMAKIILSSNEELKQILDCTEGLENALKNAAECQCPLAEKLTSARYTSSRIRRIALQNLLNIDEKLIRESLQSPLYLRVLAIKNTKKEVLSALSQSKYPIIARPRDVQALSGIAKQCFDVDEFAEKVYGLLYKQTESIDIFI